LVDEEHSLDYDEQARITEIPAPPFKEEERAAYLKKTLTAFGLLMRTDEIGNVIGERQGSSENGIILISAHMDTVFPAGTDVRVRRERGMLYARESRITAQDWRRCWRWRG